MKKQNVLMLLAVMVAIFALTTVSAQADLVTDFTDYYDTGALYANGFLGTDFTTNSPNSGDITVTAFEARIPSEGELRVSMEGLYTAVDPAVGDRFVINWDGDKGTVTPNGTEHDQNLGLRYAGASGYNIMVWYPYQDKIGVWSDGNGGTNVFYNYSPGQNYTMYMEKLAGGWTFGSIIDGNEHIIASGIQSNMGAVSGGLFSDIRNTEQTWLVSLDMPVPEPATMSLLALGGLGLIRRRSRKNSM